MVTGKKWKKGDEVIVKAEYARGQDIGVVYVVDRLGPVNVVVLPKGGGRGLRIQPDMLDPAPAGGTRSDVAAVQTVPYYEPLNPGQVVTVSGPGWNQPEGQLYVVLLQRNPDKVPLAVLGGQSNGNYWTVRRSLVTPVTQEVGIIG